MRCIEYFVDRPIYQLRYGESAIYINRKKRGLICKTNYEAHKAAELRVI